jgi:FtsH-binding integral membrane protein
MFTLPRPQRDDGAFITVAATTAPWSVSLVNIFLKSSGLDWALSVIGVLIFAGLTAWDTQKIKEFYDPQDDGTIAGRKVVMGALSLYLDFINMFMMLLRLFGDRR